jgi:hypothetical protein
MIWQDRVRRAHRFSRSRAPGRAAEVRYEEIVQDPEPALRRVADLLGLAFRPEMMEHRGGLAELGDTSAPHMATLEQPLRGDLDSRWRQLPENDRRLITRTLQDDLRVLGYLEGPLS